MSDSRHPMDSSPPGSSVHGILQARILEWVAIPSPGDFPNLRIEAVSPTSPAGGFCITELPRKPLPWILFHKNESSCPCRYCLALRSFRPVWSPGGCCLSYSSSARAGVVVLLWLVLTLYFNWHIIAFQCCASFCCTVTWTSYKWTYAPSH